MVSVLEFLDSLVFRENVAVLMAGLIPAAYVALMIEAGLAKDRPRESRSSVSQSLFTVIGIEAVMVDAVGRGGVEGDHAALCICLSFVIAIWFASIMYKRLTAGLPAKVDD